MSRLKIIGIVVASLLLLIFLWAGFDKLSTWKKSKDASEAALLTEIQDRQDQIQHLKEELKNTPVKTVIEVRTKEVPGPVRIKNIPASCKECFEGIVLPYSAKTKYWAASSPDITRKDLRVDILPAYDEEVVAPCRKSLAETTKQLANSEPYHPIRLNAEAQVGYGFAGIPGEARLSIETGRQTELSLGIGAIANLNPDGEVMVNPAITLRIERRLLPR